MKLLSNTAALRIIDSVAIVVGYNRGMSDDPIKPDPARKPKRPKDANQLAKHIVDPATGQAQEVGPDAGKDPAAVELGRKGGLKGGKAGTEKLTPEQRSEIAKKAAEARWNDDGGKVVDEVG